MSLPRNLLDTAERLLWYALTTPPQKEFVTQAIVERHGISSFVPVRREYRRRNKYAREKTLHAYPLAPRYVFVGFEPGYSLGFDLFQLRRPRENRTITGIVGMAGEPFRIPTRQMVDLMKRLGEGLKAPDIQRFMRTHREFEVGDMVRAIDGPFASLEEPVPVVEISGARAKTVVDLFGGKMEVWMPVENLEAA